MIDLDAFAFQSNDTSQDVVTAPIVTPPKQISTRRKRHSERPGDIEIDEEGGKKEAAARNQKKRYRQANEANDGVVEILCFTCRRTKDKTIQKSMTAFFAKKKGDGDTGDGCNAICIDIEDKNDLSVCARCRKPMQEKTGPVRLPGEGKKKISGPLPQLQRFRAYQRVAEKQGVPFVISEHKASALMRSACVGCGVQSPEQGHGLTRLRYWPEGMQKPARGGFMGPYIECNLASACVMCNMMKGYRTVRGLVECARHIATINTDGEDFGLYPLRFHDNVSKRARSGYITHSSTHQKTHAMTNEEFNAIVAQRCYYCHKEPRPPRTLGPDDRGHFNGLDRLDSSNRLYKADTVVACCGTCNIMKYRWPVEGFLEHCRKIARFNVNTRFLEGEEEVATDSENNDADDNAFDEDIEEQETHIGDVLLAGESNR